MRGLAAAMEALGQAAPALSSGRHPPRKPQARTVAQEIARVVRARVADPQWATGMMRHGFRGAAEIAATLDNLAAFAQLSAQVPAHLFDLTFEATLGREDVAEFMMRENPQALARMKERFAALAREGLWATRRNSIAAWLEDGS
jgi:cobaltochelatase CobN